MHRIRLGNDEFEGRNNAYLFDGDGPTVLVDTGVATETVRAQLSEGVAERGLAFADVDAVVLTHWHPDHAGLAGALQAASGATVYVHEADAALVAEGADEELDPFHVRRLEEWGLPDEMIVEVQAVAEATQGLMDPVAEVETLVEGDVVTAAGERLRVLHAPGHTAGQICLIVEGSGTALVGDAVLPVYTPNIGGADIRVDRPLPTYLESLSRIDEHGFDRLYPGHRDPIDDPAERIGTILQHHRDRTRRVIDVLDAHGSLTAWEVSAHLFGELSGVHVLHGPGEAFAHLDYLVERGDVERSGTQFRLVAEPEEATAD